MRFLLAFVATIALAARDLPFDHLLEVEPHARSRRRSSGSPAPGRNRDHLRVAPGVTATLAELRDPGPIRRSWLVVPRASNHGWRPWPRRSGMVSAP